MVNRMYILPLIEMGIIKQEEQEAVIDFLTQLAKIGIYNKTVNYFRHD